MDVRTACLGLLTFGDATGYELKKRFEDGSLGAVLDVSFGAIYPALTRLTEDGLVSCREEVQDKRPDKKVYSITPAGREAFAAALMAPLAEDRLRSPFIFAMAFADWMPLSRVHALIDDRIAEMRRKREQLALTHASCSSDAHRFVLGLGLAVYDAEIAYLTSSRHLAETAPPGRTDTLRHHAQRVLS